MFAIVELGEAINMEDKRVYYFSCSEFEEILNAYQWPFIVKTEKKPTKKDQKQQNTAEIKAKLEPLFSHLLHLQLPYPSKIKKKC